MSSRRNKIKYCYEDYVKSLPAEEAASYQKSLAPLVVIMESANTDREILDQAKTYDAKHGTDMFGEAVHFKVYCIACSKFACDC